MAKPIIFVSILATSLGFGQEGSNVPLSFPGEQKTGKYLGAVQLDYWYVRPQALGMDGDHNFYVMETRGHLKKFSTSGKYLGTVFEGAVPAIYEGFYLDAATNKATVSITKGSKVHGEKGRGIFIVEIGLKNGDVQNSDSVSATRKRG